ncbi:MAG: hypothetical protein PVH12_06260 [Candidatus Bathyarchaeota archaeon]|jgi:hypothetical protein
MIKQDDEKRNIQHRMRKQISKEDQRKPKVRTLKEKKAFQAEKSPFFRLCEFTGSFFDRFREKKVEKAKVQVEEMTDLEKICIDDKEAYKALRETMFLDPGNMVVSMKSAEKKAKDFEKEGNKLKARIWYRAAGGLAIYEGDVKKVVKYFSKFAELSPDSNCSILKIPERAVSKAQEYYRKYLKIDN